jgi:hypothetical protein
MGKWILARADKLIDNLLFKAICTGGAIVWAWVRELPIPIIIVIAISVFVGILLSAKLIRAFYIRQIVFGLVNLGIYSDCPVNITRILYHDREKLAVGLSDEVASNQDKLVLHQLNLREIVRLEQRKVRIYGSDNVRDEGYWVLTELGKKVILYLEKNPQVLHNEGSVSQ